jgi:hypothetical protein
MKKLKLPTICNMPELTKGKIKSNYLAASIGSNGKKLSKEENIYLKIYIRLVDKAFNEYDFSRDYLIKDFEQGNNVIAIFGFWDHIENCINSIRRIYNIFDRIKSINGALIVDRIERKLIETKKNIITDLRDTVEHLDEKIQIIDTYVISINTKQDGIYISSFELKFNDLHSLLERMKKIGIEWIKLFAQND